MQICDRACSIGRGSRKENAAAREILDKGGLRVLLLSRDSLRYKVNCAICRGTRRGKEPCNLLDSVSPIARDKGGTSVDERKKERETERKRREKGFRHNFSRFPSAARMNGGPLPFSPFSPVPFRAWLLLLCLSFCSSHSGLEPLRGLGPKRIP